MASLKELAETRGALLNFDPRKITIEPGFNVRDLSTPEAREHIEWIKSSIRENGFLPSHPLEIRQKGDNVLLTSGHCRLTAVLELIADGVEIASVPCVPERRGTNDVDRLLAQRLDNGGLRLSPLEEADLVKRAVGFGVELSEIARRIGKSVTYVSQALDFMAAPKEVHDMVRAGEVSATLAAKVVRKAGAEKGAKALRKAADDAKAAGKKKATAKHVDKAEIAADNEKRAGPIPIKVKGDMVTVTFFRTDVMFTREKWADEARRILAACGLAAPAVEKAFFDGTDECAATGLDAKATIEAERDMVAEAKAEMDARIEANLAEVQKAADDAAVFGTGAVFVSDAGEAKHVPLDEFRDHLREVTETQAEAAE